MKNFNLLALLLVISIAGSEAFFGRGGFGFGRRRFGGMGFRRGGFFGRRRFGLGLGFPIGIPIPLPVPVPVAVPVPVPVVPIIGGFRGGLGGFGGGFGRRFGKRSDNITVSNSTQTNCEITSFEKTSSKLICEGSTYNFECELERHFSIEHMEHHLEELRILPYEAEKEKLSKSVILSVRPEEALFNNFTMEHKDEKFLFTLFQNKNFTDDGFRFKKVDCWEDFEDMMDDEEQVKLSMRLSF